VKLLTALGALGLFAGSFSACGDDPYGLLFTTPAQRAQLDNRFNGRDAGASDAADTGGAEPQAAASLRLNGTLISNTGRKEVWINGQRQLATGSAANVWVLGPDNIQVRRTPSARPQAMKPGQVMDATTGKISEAYSSATWPRMEGK